MVSVYLKLLNRLDWATWRDDCPWCCGGYVATVSRQYWRPSLPGTQQQSTEVLALTCPSKTIWLSGQSNILWFCAKKIYSLTHITWSSWHDSLHFKDYAIYALVFTMGYYGNMVYSVTVCLECVCVTGQYCIKMAKHTKDMQLTPHNSPGTL